MYPGQKIQTWQSLTEVQIANAITATQVKTEVNGWTHTCCCRLGPTICLWGSWRCEWCRLCLHSLRAGRSCEPSWSPPPWRGTWVPLHPSPGIKPQPWEDCHDSKMRNYWHFNVWATLNCFILAVIVGLLKLITCIVLTLRFIVVLLRH